MDEKNLLAAGEFKLSRISNSVTKTKIKIVLDFLRQQETVQK